MTNRELKLQNYPTPEELYALERQARAARSAELARLLNAGFAAVRELFTSRTSTKGLRHA